MLSTHLNQALIEAERQSNAVSAALVQGEPLALASAGTELRQAALALSSLVQGLTELERNNQNLTVRLKRLADGLVFQRESLIRRTGLVERTLHALVPASRSATYAQAGAPYASTGKPTGAFKVLAA